MVNLVPHAAKGFLKPVDVKEPRQKKIVGVEMSKFDKPVLTFGDGSRLGLNGTTTADLIQLFGSPDSEEFDSDDLLGHTVELYPGQLPDGNGGIQDGIRLPTKQAKAEAIDQPKPTVPKPAPVKLMPKAAPKRPDGGLDEPLPPQYR